MYNNNDMNLKLFHGSKNIVEFPTLDFSKNNDDFGHGFYCYELEELAKEHSVSLFDNGFLNNYEIDIDFLNVINLCDKPFSLMHWITLLLEHRFFDLENENIKSRLFEKFHFDIKNFDVVIAYRADCSAFFIVEDFLNNKISYQQLKRTIKDYDLEKEVVLISERAIKEIKFLGCEQISSYEYFKMGRVRDDRLLKLYFKEKNNQRIKDNLFINDILKEDFDTSDRRL